MGFTNSPLVEYTRISPNKNECRVDYWSKPGTNIPITSIDRITIHHMAGVSTLEAFGDIVASPARAMSSNYAVDCNARVGMYCEEKHRSWCTSSKENDYHAITIEVSNSSVGGNWPVSDKVLAKVIDLCTDICKRNGIPKLYYDGKKGTLTRHCDFAATACPGPYLISKTDYICNEVNKRLTPAPVVEPTQPTQPTTSSGIKAGDLVKIKSGATYYNGSGIPTWVINDMWYVSQVSGDRAVLGRNASGNMNIQSPVKTSFLSVVATSNTTPSKTNEQITLKASDLIYSSAGGRAVSTVGANGVFTIVEKQTVGGAVYGKLKSGAGWVIISGAKASTDIVKGDKVSVIDPIIYGTNKRFQVLVKSYTVLSVTGDRCVISSDGKNVTAAIAKKYLKKIQ